MAGVTKLRTRTDASVGRQKANRRPVPSKDHFVSMEEYNDLADAVVELCAAMGLSDGSTPGSVAGTADVLFKWNETDLTQFDAASVVASAGADLTAAVTVVDSALSPNKKAISFKCTGTLANGRNAMLLMRIAAASFTAPASRRYIIRMRIADHKVASGTQRCVIGPVFLSGTSGGKPYANLVGFFDDAAASQLWHWRRDGDVLQTGANFPAFAVLGLSGGWIDIEVIGKEGSPPAWRILTTGLGTATTTLAARNLDDGSFGIANMPAAWNALVLDRAGIAMGVNANGVGVTDPYYEICEFCILRHPMDR